MTDWATEESRKTLHYLMMCDSTSEKIELLAAMLRLTEAKGACRAGEEYRAAVDDAFSKEKVA